MREKGNIMQREFKVKLCFIDVMRTYTFTHSISLHNHNLQV
jgi:hypothetical protein